MGFTLQTIGVDECFDAGPVFLATHRDGDIERVRRRLVAAFEAEGYSAGVNEYGSVVIDGGLFSLEDESGTVELFGGLRADCS